MSSSAKKCLSNGNSKMEPVRCSFCRRYLGHFARSKDCLVYIHCHQCKNYTVVLGEKQASLTDEELSAKVVW